MEQFDSTLSSVINSTLDLRCRLSGYQYSDIHSLMSIYFGSDSCIENVTTHLSKMYDIDFDHQFIETEKHDAKPTYKKFSGVTMPTQMYYRLV